ncbi:hypothetical protein HN51_045928 [Arachis hypogaea]|uniref:uncharacterized protein At4g14100 n=1 Tax=Arachis ipaensis TaxID=130454 RepID=UPI0007AF832B|nr:uncharacterized protein At4g14100 [Arachis ipaensis]XP_025671723.1 uncharacterized protein At4g14100 [Arachis hypogaea]QHN98179.1 uncharacterized protein DS421_18g633810 [Arachis hypogaea]
MGAPMSSLFFLLLLLLLLPPSLSMASKPPPPTPSEWPLQFHSLIWYNRTGVLQKVELWYDFINGRNLNIIEEQLTNHVLYDVEWDNGTSFYYTLDPYQRECDVKHFPVGILRPNWLHGATYLGQRMVDNFLCNVWEKVHFIRYYEHVATKRPVKWVFFEGPPGYTAHVMTFEVGAVLDDPNWQAPVYCFTDEAKKENPNPKIASLQSLIMTWISLWKTATV